MFVVIEKVQGKGFEPLECQSSIGFLTDKIFNFTQKL